jgi:hypothetical protein
MKPYGDYAQLLKSSCLAHEIAVNGVPGPTNTPIRLKDLPSDLAGLAG